MIFNSPFINCWPLFEAAAVAATTAAAFKRVKAEDAATAAFVELAVAALTNERWFLSKARWLGAWFNWFKTSATLQWKHMNEHGILIKYESSFYEPGNLPVFRVTISEAFSKWIRRDLELSYSMVLIGRDRNKFSLVKYDCAKILKLVLMMSLMFSHASIGRWLWIGLKVFTIEQRINVAKCCRSSEIGHGCSSCLLRSRFVLAIRWQWCSSIRRMLTQINNMKSWLITMHWIKYNLWFKIHRIRKLSLAIGTMNWVWSLHVRCRP